jgi:hypothetical protein
MLSFQASARSIIKNEPWKSGTLKGVYVSSVSRWENELGSANICLVEVVTSKLLEQVGYTKLGCKNKIRTIILSVQDIYKMIKYKFIKNREARKDNFTTHFSNARVLSNLIKSLIYT